MSTRTQNKEMTKMLSQFSNPYSLRNIASEYLIGGTMNAIKNKFGISFRINLNEMPKAFKWIEDHDPKYDKHVSNPQQVLIEKVSENLMTDRKYICDKRFVIKLCKATYAYIDAGPSRTPSDGYTNDSINEDMPQYLHIYIFGKKMFRYAKQLAIELTNTAKEYLNMYKVNGGSNRGGKDENSLYFEVIASDLHTRSVDTLFFDDDCKERIIDHVDKFLANEKIYKDRSLLYKTGVILHGPAGTGKSSLATAIATHYGYDVISIDMTTFNTLDVNCLVESINADNFKYIVLLEDIDAVVKDRENKNPKGEKADKEDNKIINKLLQFLDSNTSPTDVIFIATTNHIDWLDDAIIRDGRFDLKVEVKELSIDNVVGMCKSFSLTDDQILQIQTDIKVMGRETINQSKLQNMILRVVENEKEDKDENYDEVPDTEYDSTELSNDKFVSITDAALMSGKSKNTIYRYLTKGKIIGVKQDSGRWLVYRDSLLDFINKSIK